MSWVWQSLAAQGLENLIRALNRKLKALEHHLAQQPDWEDQNLRGGLDIDLSPFTGPDGRDYIDVTIDAAETRATVLVRQEGGGDAGWRVWAAGGEGTLLEVSELGRVTAKAEIEGTVAILTDGVLEPATIAGKAQVYIDQADGDLKIKYGDGTVKLIVTDT